LQATICTYRNWEKNRSNPSSPFIPKMIKLLGYVPYSTQTQDFGKKIATSRGLPGLSQKDLARLMGVNPCTILIEAKYCKTVARPSGITSSFFV
jgi:transcriptional regulator with XRE-family HTH domain